MNDMPVKNSVSTYKIELVNAAVAAGLSDDIIRIHNDVYSDSPFNRPSSGIDFGTAVLPLHLGRKEFSLTTARDASGAIVGYCYGYVGDHGQFWTDYVADRIHPSLEKAWLGDHLEIVELAVEKSARGKGVGRSLLTALLDSRGDDRMALLTVAKKAPALDLYESIGFTSFGEFENFVLLGRRRS
jgi:ribosomal protein S18 acetylase RimI-like enzyme